MGSFFKLQWSYCGFHVGGIYEWGHFSNFSGATVVFMLVEYMNGDIFQTSAAPPYQALFISLFLLNHIYIYTGIEKTFIYI